MDQKKLHDLVLLYQINSSDETRDKLLTFLSDFMYNFPTIAFRVSDEDFLSDFYLASLKKFDKIIGLYDGSVGFITFFSVSLKNIYFDRKRNVLQKKDNLAYVDPYIHETILLDNILAPSSVKGEQIKSEFFINHTPDEEQYLVIKLYFFDFFNEDDFVLLKKRSGRSYEQCATFIEYLQNKLFEAKDRQLRYAGFAENMIDKIINLQAKVRSMRTNSKDYDKKIFFDNENQLREKQNQYLSKFHKNRWQPPIKDLAMFLEKDESFVSNAVSRFKKRVRNGKKSA